MCEMSTLLLFTDELLDEALSLLEFTDEATLKLSKSTDYLIACFMGCLDCFDFTPCNNYFASIYFFNCNALFYSSYRLDYNSFLD